MQPLLKLKQITSPANSELVASHFTAVNSDNAKLILLTLQPMSEDHLYHMRYCIRENTGVTVINEFLTEFLLPLNPVLRNAILEHSVYDNAVTVNLLDSFALLLLRTFSPKNGDGLSTDDRRAYWQLLQQQYDKFMSTFRAVQTNGVITETIT